MPSQTASGKGFEYALAAEVSSAFGVDILGDAQVAARNAYISLADDEQAERRSAARAALSFLSQRERRLINGNVAAVKMQPDSVARQGDVRDLVVVTSDGVGFGISAKNRNTAIRNSRLSHRIDFGDEWFGTPCSATYHEAKQPIFDFLEPLENQNVFWRDLPDKLDRVYLPLMRAFIDETVRIFETQPNQSTKNMMRYMLGTRDYYKIFKQNGDVSVQSFNLDNTLKWGKLLPMPTRLIELSMKPNSKNTAYMYLDAGWQLSFRIHNARSRVERSLKFDIQIIGQPPQLNQQFIQYR